METYHASVAVSETAHVHAIIVVMTDGTTPVTISGEAPTAVELRFAVHGGDLPGRRLVSDNPALVRASFVARGGSSTALHFVTDWPGYFPNGPDIVNLLIDAGADPNATTTGPGNPETPLHYAASSDDLDVAAALIDRGGISKPPTAPSARPWTTPSAMGAGTSHASWRRGAPASKRCGTRQPSVHWTPWRLSWYLGSTARRSQKASGTRAALGNAVPLNACCMRVPISTGSPTTQKVPPWMPRLVSGPDKRM